MTLAIQSEEQSHVCTALLTLVVRENNRLALLPVVLGVEEFLSVDVSSEHHFEGDRVWLGHPEGGSARLQMSLEPIAEVLFGRSFIVHNSGTERAQKDDKVDDNYPEFYIDL